MRTPWILLIVSSLLTGGFGVDSLAQPQEVGVLGDFVASQPRTTPKVGRATILRTDFDLTGDGSPEVFLSRPGSWMQNGFLWSVYEVTGESAFNKLGSARFNEGFVRVTDPGSLRILEPRAVGRWWLVEYNLLSGKLAEVDRRPLDEGNESERETIEAERAAMREFWQEHDIPSARAEIPEPGTLTPWRSSETGEVLPGLVPISPGFRSAPSTSGQPKSLQADQRTLLEHIQEHRPCATAGCEIYLELRDVTGEGEPELLLRTSDHFDAPLLVYARRAGDLRFLGELPFAPWRLHEDGRFLVLRRDPKVLEVYRVTQEGIVRLETVPATSDPERVESERNRMARRQMEMESRKNLFLFRASWEQASANPSDVHWLTFRTREPAAVELKLSTPVTKPEPDDSIER